MVQGRVTFRETTSFGVVYGIIRDYVLAGTQGVSEQGVQIGELHSLFLVLAVQGRCFLIPRYIGNGIGFQYRSTISMQHFSDKPVFTSSD